MVEDRLMIIKQEMAKSNLAVKKTSPTELNNNKLGSGSFKFKQNQK